MRRSRHDADYVLLVDPPRGGRMVVVCEEVDECLRVLEAESKGAPEGTTFAMLAYSDVDVRPLHRWGKVRGKLVRGKAYRANGRDGCDECLFVANARGSSKAAMRYLRWSSLRDQIREIRDKQSKVRKKRKADLAEVREQCAELRRKATAWCQTERRSARDEARDELDKLEDARRTLWKIYGTKKKDDHKYSAAEHDDFTEQNIEPELVPVFRKLKRHFPRDVTPDRRAEMFHEWVEAHPDEVLEYRTQLVPSDDEFARAYYGEAG